MKRILVLGGGGFIGGHLARHFRESGDFVRVIDLKKHSYFKDSEICNDFVIADLRHSLKVLKAFQVEYDEIYQLASDVGGAGYIFGQKNDADIISNSALININIARHVNRNVGKLFFASSSCADPPDGDYGHEKLFSEKLYLAFSRNKGLKVSIARFQNVFGTHDTIFGTKERFMTAVCRKIAQANSGDPIEVWGDGNQKRSFIFVEDCICEILNLMETEISEPVNIGSVRPISINEITNLLIGISGKDLKIENISGEAFLKKYGFVCPVGVQEKENSADMTSEISDEGLILTYNWVKGMVS